MHDDDDPTALARLLGVDPGLDPARLRSAYDQEMSRATRSGDHRRALALSQAYDALPGRTRSSVYSGGSSVLPTVVLGPAPRRPSRRTRRVGTSPRRRRRISWKGVIGYGLVVPAIVVLVGWSIYRQNQGPDYGSPPPDDRSPAVVAPPEVALRIPADARVGADGRARVLCAGLDGEPGYTLTAPPGATVSCADGVTPVIISP